MYKLIKEDGKTINVYNIEKHLWIPVDPANTDYQAYLQWLAEGNEPLPADEPEEQP
jgi:hypothetical protein